MFEKGLDRITCSLCLLQANTAFSLCNTHTYFLIPPVPCFLPLPVETPPPPPFLACGRMRQDLLLKHMHGWVMTASTQKHEFLCLKRAAPSLPGCRSVVLLVVTFKTAE